MAKSGIMGDLVMLAKMDDYLTVRQACGALANLSENKDTHTFLIGDADTVPVLCDLVNHVDLALVREVTRCFTNLAGNYDTHYQLMENSVADALTKSLRNPDAIVTRFAAVGIVNLTAVPENQGAFLATGAHEVMTELALGEPRSWNDLNDDGDPDADDGDLEDIPPPGGADNNNDNNADSRPASQQTSSRPNTAPGGAAMGGKAPVERSAQAQREYDLLQDLGYDMESRRYACLALGNLCSVADNHDALLEAGLMEALKDSLLVEDLETRFNAGFCANKLAMRESNLATMGEAELVAPLVRLAGDPDDPARTQAISALRRMALLAENRTETVECDALKPLAAAAISKDLEAKREVSACLCNLALSDANKVKIVVSPCLRPLIELCESPDVETARLACGAAANVAEDNMTHRPLLFKGNALHTLVYLMRSKHLSVHREASRAVSNILSTEASHTIFLEEDGLRSLFLVARSQDNECQYNAALIFRKLAPNLANHDLVIGKGGLQPLIGLVQLRDVRVQRIAAAALWYFSSNKDHKVSENRTNRGTILTVGRRTNTSRIR